MSPVYESFIRVVGVLFVPRTTQQGRTRAATNLAVITTGVFCPTLVTQNIIWKGRIDRGLKCPTCECGVFVSSPSVLSYIQRLCLL